MFTPSLFDTREPFDRRGLAEKLRRLAASGIWIGTSSWKYEGWMGQVYRRERYLSRGSFSSRSFEAGCLREYSETFPAVCGDFSFYQFPDEDYWARLFGCAPETLRFAFKVPEQITVRTFPSHPRYGARGGLVNSSFLDAALLEESFLRRLEPYRSRVSALIVEFGTLSKTAYPHVRNFLEDLDQFLRAAPRSFRLSVEIRNPEFLVPEYFQLLRAHGVAHVFNSWTRMPTLGAQLRCPEAFTADFTVCRALLRPGRKYEDAVKLFSPYEDIRDEYPEGRQAIRALIDYARSNRLEAFIYVNNRFEGNAPRTIEALAED